MKLNCDRHKIFPFRVFGWSRNQKLFVAQLDVNYPQHAMSPWDTWCWTSYTCMVIEFGGQCHFGFQQTHPIFGCPTLAFEMYEYERIRVYIYICYYTKRILRNPYFRQIIQLLAFYFHHYSGVVFVYFKAKAQESFVNHHFILLFYIKQTIRVVKYWTNSSIFFRQTNTSFHIVSHGITIQVNMFIRYLLWDAMWICVWVSLWAYEYVCECVSQCECETHYKCITFCQTRKNHNLLRNRTIQCRRRRRALRSPNHFHIFPFGHISFS